MGVFHGSVSRSRPQMWRWVELQLVLLAMPNGGFKTVEKVWLVIWKKNKKSYIKRACSIQECTMYKNDVVSGKWMRQKNYLYFKISEIKVILFKVIFQILVTFCHSHQNKASPAVVLSSGKCRWYEETNATLRKAMKEVSSQCGVRSK